MSPGGRAVSATGSQGSWPSSLRCRPAAPLSAQAAPTWLPRAPLSPAGASAQAPQVAVDPGGDAVSAWERLNAETSHEVIEVAGRPAGPGPWQPARTISNSGLQSSDPQVGIDAAGDAVAVWLSFDGSEYSYLESSRQGVAGTWSPPVTLKKIGAMTTMRTAARSGRRRRRRCRRCVGAAQRAGCRSSKRSAAWGRPVAGAHPKRSPKMAKTCTRRKLAIDATGAATAVWEERGSPLRIDASERPAGGSMAARRADLERRTERQRTTRGRRRAGPRRRRVGTVQRRTRGDRHGRHPSGPESRLAQPGGTDKPARRSRNRPAQQVAIDGQGQAVVSWSWGRENEAKPPTNEDLVEAVAGNAATGTWGAPATPLRPRGRGRRAASAGRRRTGRRGRRVGTVEWRQEDRRSGQRLSPDRGLASGGRAVGGSRRRRRTAGGDGRPTATRPPCGATSTAPPTSSKLPASTAPDPSSTEVDRSRRRHRWHTAHLHRLTI